MLRIWANQRMKITRTVGCLFYLRTPHTHNFRGLSLSTPPIAAYVLPYGRSRLELYNVLIQSLVSGPAV